MAQYMLLIYGDESAGDELSEEEANESMGRWFAYTEELKASGDHVAGDALHPTSAARSIHFGDGAGTVTDGPFAETKEQLGGYYLVDVDSEERALEWARKIPLRRGTVEVRPVMVFDSADAPA